MTKGEFDPITVNFGDEFIPTFSNRKRFIVVETGEENVCSASQIVQKDGKEAVSLPGTTTRDDVQQVLGRWDLQRIINGLMNYYDDTVPEGGVYD